jgi:WD40 repeat protein
MDIGASDGNLVVRSLSADGRTVAATTEQGTTAVWSTETLERLDVRGFGRGRLVGNWLWAFEGGSVQRFDPWTNERVGIPLFGQQGNVFYPDLDETNGRVAIMGSDLVRVFDLDSGKQLGRELPYKPIRITYTANGSQLAVANDDRVSIWNYDTDTWADIACQLAGSNFTEEEWEQLGPRTIERRATCPQFPLSQ